MSMDVENFVNEGMKDAGIEIPQEEGLADSQADAQEQNAEQSEANTEQLEKDAESKDRLNLDSDDFVDGSNAEFILNIKLDDPDDYLTVADARKAIGGDTFEGKDRDDYLTAGELRSEIDRVQNNPVRQKVMQARQQEQVLDGILESDQQDLRESDSPASRHDPRGGDYFRKQEDAFNEMFNGPDRYEISNQPPLGQAG